MGAFTKCPSSCGLRKVSTPASQLGVPPPSQMSWIFANELSVLQQSGNQSAYSWALSLVAYFAANRGVNYVQNSKIVPLLPVRFGRKYFFDGISLSCKIWVFVYSQWHSWRRNWTWKSTMFQTNIGWWWWTLDNKLEACRNEVANTFRWNSAATTTTSQWKSTQG